MKEKSRVLLINPQIGFSPPYGLMWIASYLESKGHPVRIVELNTYNRATIGDTSELLDALDNFKPAVAGITVLTAYTDLAKQLISFIKGRRPDTLVVLGGYHPSAMPGECLSWGCDAVVTGEGEVTLAEIADTVQNSRPVDTVPGLVVMRGGRLAASPARPLIDDVNTLPMPAYHLIDMDQYVAGNYAIRGKWLRCGWVMTSRGCPGHCTFCASELIHGHRIRERTIASVIKELEFLVSRYGIEAFWILDDTFTIKEQRVCEFCEALKQSGLSLKWGCQARVNTITETMARVMKEHGCLQVDFGVESGSQRVLDAIKKGITVEQTERAFGICRKTGLRALATVMIGNPEERREDVEKTVRLLKKIRPAYTGVFFATPYPGTKMYEDAKKHGWIDEQAITWEHIESPSMEVYLTKKEQEEFYRVLVKGSFIKTVLGYTLDAGFMRDFTMLCLRDPRFFARVVSFLAAGRLKEAINLFREKRIVRTKRVK